MLELRDLNSSMTLGTTNLMRDKAKTWTMGSAIEETTLGRRVKHIYYQETAPWFSQNRIHLYFLFLAKETIGFRLVTLLTPSDYRCDGLFSPLTDCLIFSEKLGFRSLQ